MGGSNDQDVERKLLTLLEYEQAVSESSTASPHEREQATLQCVRILVALALIRAPEEPGERVADLDSLF